MVMKFEGAITWSRWADFDQCGLLFQLRHIEKRKEPPAPHFVKGARVHEHVDAWLKRRIPLLPDEAEPLALQLLALRKEKNLVGEEAWGYTEEWEPLPVTGYFSKRDWLRAKIDALVIKAKLLRVIDFKTGKMRPISAEQVKFYGMLALLRYENVETAALELWYLEQGMVEAHTPVERAEIPKLKREYELKFQRMTSATKFLPNPGLYCRWCPFSKQRGGPCTY